MTSRIRPSSPRVRTSITIGRVGTVDEPVTAERQLAVGARLDVAPGRLARVAAVEVADRLAAAEPGVRRRHGEDRVLGEHGHDGVDVAALPGVHVAADDGADGLVAERAQRRLLALARQALLQRAARALQGAVDRRHRGLERLRHLGRAEAEHLAQQQHRALPRRQALDGRDQRQLERLALLVAGLRTRRVGLDPDALGQRRPELGAVLGRGREVDREHPPALGLLEARVGRDRVQPRAQRAALLEAGEPAPGAQQRLLDGVLGVVHRAEHAVAVRVQLAPVRLHQRAERVLVARRAPRSGAREPLPSKALTSAGRSCWIQWPQPSRMCEETRPGSVGGTAIASAIQVVEASRRPPMNSDGWVSVLPSQAARSSQSRSMFR